MRLLRLLIVGLLLAITQPFGASADETDDALKHSILQTWTQRSTEIRTLHLQLKFDEFIQGRPQPRKDAPGPFDEIAPATDATLQGSGEFAFSGGHIATRVLTPRIDPYLPGGIRQQHVLATFDGVENRELIVEMSLPLGSIEMAKRPIPRITTDMRFLGAALWLYPQLVFNDAAWLDEQMSFEKDKVDVDGIPCTRIRIPRKGKRWTSALDVDLQHGCIPLQWQTWAGGRLSMRVSISYNRSAPNQPPTHPVFESWTVAFFDDDGEVEHSIRAQVTKAELNKDLDDALFTIAFPVGAHIAKNDAGVRTYHIQGAGGLQPLDKKDYGRIPSKEEL
jgi:hypothetical protein